MISISSIAKAKQRGIIAIHPGWGFASEDERFPQKCEEAGITFIGSKADSMNLLGNKVQVRKIAKRLGIPVVPGSEGAVDVPAARKVVDEITLPIMLKAEGGGGGRGIFLVREKSELEDAFFKASAMAQASFGNPRLYVEKYLEQVRHIEIQVIADQHGNVFAFDERDCSVQRNHQKLVEITPSPWAGITPELRERLKEYSRMLVREVGLLLPRHGGVPRHPAGRTLPHRRSEHPPSGGTRHHRKPFQASTSSKSRSPWPSARSCA